MWTEIHLTTSEKNADALGAQLNLLGAEAITFRDGGDQPIYEPTPDMTLWQETIVIGLFNSDSSIESVTTYLKEQQALGTLKHFHLEQLPDEDWERRCLENFKPLAFGKRLWICPSWETFPDPLAVNILLDPGLAFGTGTHPTTALCLEWLDENLREEQCLIDYGCGSGILSLAAVKLGAKKVLAIDHDPQALEATRLNADRNQISSHQLEVFLLKKPSNQLLSHLEKKSLADVLISNILAEPLIKLADYFSTLIKPNGHIVLSGILEEQAESVINAYKTMFYVNDFVSKEGWVRIQGVRK